MTAQLALYAWMDRISALERDWMRSWYALDDATRADLLYGEGWQEREAAQRAQLMETMTMPIEASMRASETVKLNAVLMDCKAKVNSYPDSDV